LQQAAESSPQLFFWINGKKIEINGCLLYNSRIAIVAELFEELVRSCECIVVFCFAAVPFLTESLSGLFVAAAA
jgi:hypothetical protein